MILDCFFTSEFFPEIYKLIKTTNPYLILNSKNIEKNHSLFDKNGNST